MSQSNIAALRANLVSSDWSFIEQISNVNEAYDSFLNKFNALLDNNIPIVNKTFKTYSKDHKSLITSGIINCKRRKKQSLSRFSSKENSKLGTNTYLIKIN